jgi:hypothetical protein
MEGSFKIKKMDKRITGSSVIDEVLQSVSYILHLSAHVDHVDATSKMPGHAFYAPAIKWAWHIVLRCSVIPASSVYVQ